MQKFWITIFVCVSFNLFGKSNEGGVYSANELLKLAIDSFYVSSEKAFEYAQEALELSTVQKDKKLMANAYFQMSRASFAIRDYDSSTKFALLSEQLLLELNEKFSLASVYSILANSYYRVADYEKFIFYSDKAIDLAEKTNNQNALMEQFYTRAIKSHEENNISTCINYINKALALKNYTKESMQIIHRCYNLMSVIYEDLGLHERAVKYLVQAINLAETQTLYRDLIYYYSNISNLHIHLKNFDSAFIYCNKSLHAFEKISIEPLKAIVYNCYARYYASISQYDSAKYYINMAIEMKEVFFLSAFDYYYEAGNIYFEAKDYEKALFYAKEANTMAEESHSHVIKHNTDKLIGDIYFKMGNAEFASFYYGQYFKGDTLKNLIQAQQEILKLSELIAKEQTDNKLKDINNKRKILIACLYISAGFIIILIFMLRRFLHQKSKINQINKELSENKFELEQLIEHKDRQLDDKEQQYINLCNNMINGAIFRMIFYKDNIQQSEVVFVSSGWEKMTNLQNEEILFFSKNIFPADKYNLLNAIDTAIKNCSELDVTFRYVRYNTIFWFHVRATVTKSENEGFVNLDGYLVDETEQKIFEKQLVEAKEKAEDSDKLKTAFLNNISHEIRTPMNAIIGFSNMIISGIIQQEERDSYLKIINDNCLSLLNIINNIVEISRIETNQTKLNICEISINETKDEIKFWMFPVFEEKYPKIDFKINNNFEFLGNLTFFADKSFLTKVFEHLIDNAGKFTSEGFVEVGVILEEPNIHFYVKDTGIGIDHDNFDNVFVNFIKLNPHLYSGTGLGLPIAKIMILKMGGSIWFESDLNVGSIFHFTLPIKKQENL